MYAVCSLSELAFDEELLFGQLNITICRLQGVTDIKGKRLQKCGD